MPEEDVLPEELPEEPPDVEPPPDVELLPEEEDELDSLYVKLLPLL